MARSSADGSAYIVPPGTAAATGPPTIGLRRRLCSRDRCRLRDRRPATHAPSGCIPPGFLNAERQRILTNLTEKVALVTGASRGIGAAVAERLATAGARVAITYNTSPQGAEDVASRIRKIGREAIVLKADSADASALTAAVNDTAGHFGRLDVLVNNAGYVEVRDFDEVTVEDFDRSYAVMLRSVFVAVKAALRYLPPGGRIINMGSATTEYLMFPGLSVYNMTKAGMVGLTRGLARDLGPRGITINTVQPGPVDTDLNPPDSEAAEVHKLVLAVGRRGTTDDVAALVAFLAGPESGFINGAAYTIDGGYSC